MGRTCPSFLTLLPEKETSHADSAWEHRRRPTADTCVSRLIPHITLYVYVSLVFRMALKDVSQQSTFSLGSKTSKSPLGFSSLLAIMVSQRFLLPNVTQDDLPRSLFKLPTPGKARLIQRRDLAFLYIILLLKIMNVFK